MLQLCVLVLGLQAPTPTTDSPAEGSDPDAEVQTDEPDLAADETDTIDDETLPESPACPCDELDWRCQQQTPGCLDDAASTAEATDTEVAPVAVSPTPTTSATGEATDVASPPLFDRTGFLLSASTGVAQCREPLCALIKVGGHGRLELGYRHRFIAPVFGISLGGAELEIDDFTGPGLPNVPPESSGSLRFFDVGFGIQAFPVLQGRFDPFFSVALGYSRVTARAKDEDLSYEARYSRGGARLGTGLAVYVGEHVALGPRFDVTVPFGGEFCESLDGNGTIGDDEVCTDVSAIIDEQTTSFDERLVRRNFPRPWSLAVDLRVVF